MLDIKRARIEVMMALQILTRNVTPESRTLALHHLNRAWRLLQPMTPKEAFEGAVVVGASWEEEGFSGRIVALLEDVKGLLDLLDEMQEMQSNETVQATKALKKLLEG